MATQMAGVFPVYDNAFKVGATKTTAKPIAEAETFSVSFDNGVETWSPMEEKGWQKAMLTSKAITISISGKRHKGDAGNDFVASKAFAQGKDAEGYFAWIFPDGTLIEWEKAVFNVKNVGSGDSTNIGGLEVDIISNGKPTIGTASA